MYKPILHTKLGDDPGTLAVHQSLTVSIYRTVWQRIINTLITEKFTDLVKRNLMTIGGHVSLYLSWFALCSVSLRT